jgi:hypothetical protein
MKKIIAILTIILLGALVTMFPRSNHICELDCDDPSPKNNLKTPVTSKDTAHLESEKTTTSLKTTGVTSEKLKKVPLDGNWCDAKKDLTPSDFDLVEKANEDWQVYLGKAFTKRGNAVHLGDEHHDNNQYVAPYQELSPRELEQLAYSGDKWAMIAFVQSGTFKQRDKMKQIANKLLISGALYHSIEFLTINELAAAKSNARLEKMDKSNHHMINAITYVMLGLQHYTDSGLIAYLGNITRNEIYQDILDPQRIINENRQELLDNFQNLIGDINKAREEQSIQFEEPNLFVKKLFEERLAIIQYGRDKHIKGLLELALPASSLLTQTTCKRLIMKELAETK